MTVTRITLTAVAAVTLLARSHAAAADEHCPDFGGDTQWLNDFY